VFYLKLHFPFVKLRVSWLLGHILTFTLHFLFFRFLLGSSDSESEDERRVVRSAKDRATEELLSICNEIRVCPQGYFIENIDDSIPCIYIILNASTSIFLIFSCKTGLCLNCFIFFCSLFADIPFLFSPFLSSIYLQNKMHINDWQSIQTLWDKLNKQVEKTQKLTGALGTPRPFIKIMVELEDFLNKTLAGT
jgi:hypothetical protein